MEQWFNTEHTQKVCVVNSEKGTDAPAWPCCACGHDVWVCSNNFHTWGKKDEKIQKNYIVQKNTAVGGREISKELRLLCADIIV